MEKITRFRDIPQFTRAGGYEVDYALEYLVKQFAEFEKEEGLQMMPDFQRGHVWTEQQQIAYIEFILRGGRSGKVIYLNNPSWHHQVKEGAYNDFVIVDGLQRVTAIRRFINNEIKVFGSYYKEFTDTLGINTTVRVNINDLPTKAAVLKWYLEMNSGGTPHSDSEINRVQQMLEEENEKTC